MDLHARKLLVPAILAMAVATAITSAPALAQCRSNNNAVGVIVDRGRASTDPLLVRSPFAHVFDPDSMQITASVLLPLPPFAGIFDVDIAPDLGEAYISNSDVNEVWVINLRTNPPSVATGINPIPLNLLSSSEDLSLTPDGRYLLAASNNWLMDGGSSISVIDVRHRVETSFRAFNPSSPTAVEVAPDGSVLVAELVTSEPSTGSSKVHRYRIDHHGALVDTGDLADENTVPAVQNLLVPNYPQLPEFLNALLSRHTVYVSRPAYGSMGSLRTRGLAPVDSATLPNPTGIDLCFDPWRSILYVRSNELGVSGGAGAGNSRIDGYYFSPLTGRFGAQVMTVSLDRRAGTAFGVEQTAVDPRTRRLFVSGLSLGEIRVFDSVTGALVGTMTSPDITQTLGICIRRR